MSTFTQSGVYKKRRNCVLVDILDAILNMLLIQLSKYKRFTTLLTALQNLIKMQTNFPFQNSLMSSMVGKMYLVNILDDILNFRHC